jgi:hypothetical protein
MNAQKMWQFETAQFRIVWSIEPDEDCDFSWDETGETAENLRSGRWQCFTSCVSVIHKPTGITLAEDCLGGSIYEKPADFRDHFGCRQNGHGSYFSDMVRQAVSDARETIESLKAMQ